METDYFTQLLQQTDKPNFSNTLEQQQPISDENPTLNDYSINLPKKQEAETITHEQHQASIKDTPSYYLGLFIDDELIVLLLQQITEQSDKINLSQDELRCFLGVLYLSGYLQVPRRRMLWERSADTHNSVVASAIQRDRFEIIFTAINSNLKFEPIIACMNEKFMMAAPLDPEQNIGEMSQNNIWCACSRNGYCSYVFVNKTALAGHDVILNIANKLLPLGLNSVLFENVYFEHNLLYELHRMGVKAVAVSRKKSQCINQPAAGIDKLESNLKLYPISMKSKKISSQIFTFILDLCMHNAYALYRLSIGDKKFLDLLSFRRNIVIYYLQRYGKPITVKKGRSLKAKKPRLDPSDARYDGIRHYVVPQSKQTRCAKCTMKTTTRCQKCDVGVHVKCFVEFHTRPKVLG